MKIDEIRFDEKGLVPVVVQNAFNKDVLMIASMSRESLEKTLETGLVTFWSKSRNELWVKGATSGDYLRLGWIQVNCHLNSLLVWATPVGNTCHTGTENCFQECLGKARLLEGPVGKEVEWERVPHGGVVVEY